MILVTGASGFVGQPLCETLTSQGYEVRQVTRDKEKSRNDNTVYISSIGSHTDWDEALQGVDTVIHLAARVHVMNETSKNPIDLYREVNAYGTFKLAQDALNKGVKKFIYLSTIKVNGEITKTPFTESSIPNPTDPYGISKFEAEMMIKDLCKEGSMDLVILRPPLIYGPHVKGNLYKILSAIQRGIPLPLGGINNKRTMIYLGSLIHLIITILRKEEPINDTFLIGDQKGISTTELIQKIRENLNPKQILVPFPKFLIKTIGYLAGKTDEIQRLTDNLEIDTSYINKKLGWTPPYTIEDGLKEMSNWFKECTK